MATPSNNVVSEAATAAATQHGSILLVDDEPVIRDATSKYLQDRLPNVHVTTAANGEDALALLNSRRFDLLVTDLNMPGGDGMTLIAEVNKQRHPCQMVVISAHAGLEVEHDLREQGVLATLRKPFELKDLAQLAKASIDARRRGVEGLSPAGVAQLLAIENKTGMLRVRGRQGHGDLFFLDGRLVNAAYERQHGREAALQIFSWDDVTVEIHDITLTLPEEIEEPLNFLVLEAARLKDEANRGQPEETVPVSEEKPHNSRELTEMANVAESLQSLTSVDGFIGTALVDYESGMVLGHHGGGDQIDLEVAGAGNTEVVRAKMRVMQATNLDDRIEDVLITLGHHYHLIRLLESQPGLFLYLAIDRERSNLALARRKLSQIEADLTL